MKKLIALIVLVGMVAQTPAAILMPVKIEKIKTERIDLKNIRSLGPALNKGNPTGGGGGPVIGAVGGLATLAAGNTLNTQVKRHTGSDIGEHISNTAVSINRGTQGDRSVAGGIMNTITSIFK